MAPRDPFEEARLRRLSQKPSLLRSEPMVMLQMIVQADAASETVEELGDMGTVMFCDLNEGATAFKRNFVAQMKDCDEVDRCLRFISEQVALAPAAALERADDSDVDEGPPLVERLPGSFASMKAMLQEVVTDLKQLNTSQAQLTINYNHLVELSHVLQKCDDIFSEARTFSDSSVVPRTLSSADLHRQQSLAAMGLGPLPPADDSHGGGGAGHSSSSSGGRGGGGLRREPEPLGSGFMPTMPGGGIDLEDGLSRQLRHGLALSGEVQSRLGYVAGVISRARLASFERVVFRATRGNMYLRHADISQQVRDPHSGELVYKSVFIIFFSGQRSLDRVLKICDTFGANRYSYPPHVAQRNQLLTEV